MSLVVNKQYYLDTGLLIYENSWFENVMMLFGVLEIEIC